MHKLNYDFRNLNSFLFGISLAIFIITLIFEKFKNIEYKRIYFYLHYKFVINNIVISVDFFIILVSKNNYNKQKYST